MLRLSAFTLIIVLVLFQGFKENSIKYVFVDLDNEVSTSDMSVLKDQVGLENIERNLKYFHGFVAYASPSKIVEIKRDTSVYIEEDGSVSAPPPEGCNFEPPQQIEQVVPWGVKRVNADQAWEYTKGFGITVCVIDTGVSNHLDLEANIVGGEAIVGKDWRDDHGHGTHVAGIIAALDNEIGIIGIAPMANIFAIKVLDKTGNGSNSQVADGIMAATRAGCQIVNMSLGGPTPSRLVEEAVEYANKIGLIIVAASGNNSGPVNYPAAYPGVLSINASTPNDTLASFSSRGKETSYISPGVNILSLELKNKYSRKNGTSMAAPMAAGVIALMLSVDKNQLMTIDLGLPQEHQGAGLPDALESVRIK